jgi:hypothetical protein
VPGSLDVALSLQGIDHPTGGALVQIQLAGQVVQGECPTTLKRLQSPTLGHRNIVTAYAVPIAELIDALQVVENLV